MPASHWLAVLAALEMAAAGAPVVMTETCGFTVAFASAGLTFKRSDFRPLGNPISSLVQEEGFRDLPQVARDRLRRERFKRREVAHATPAVYEDAIHGLGDQGS